MVTVHIKIVKDFLVKKDEDSEAVSTDILHSINSSN